MALRSYRRFRRWWFCHVVAGLVGCTSIAPSPLAPGRPRTIWQAHPAYHVAQMGSAQDYGGVIIWQNGYGGLNANPLDDGNPLSAGTNLVASQPVYLQTNETSVVLITPDTATYPFPGPFVPAQPVYVIEPPGTGLTQVPSEIAPVSPLNSLVGAAEVQIAPTATQVAPGGALALVASVSGADGPLFDFTWAAEEGLLIQNKGANVQWLAPSLPGSYVVWVTATDPVSMLSITGSLTIAVQPPLLTITPSPVATGAVP